MGLLCGSLEKVDIIREKFWFGKEEKQIQEVIISWINLYFNICYFLENYEIFIKIVAEM